VASTVQGKCVYRALVGKLEGKRVLRRLGSRWEYIIGIYFQETSLDVVDRTDLADDTASGVFA
jgi:hypothetical protein